MAGSTSDLERLVAGLLDRKGPVIVHSDVSPVAYHDSHVVWGPSLT
jgi:hypothetical protein